MCKFISELDSFTGRELSEFSFLNKIEPDESCMLLEFKVIGVEMLGLRFKILLFIFFDITETFSFSFDFLKNLNRPTLLSLVEPTFSTSFLTFFTSFDLY